MQGRWCFSARSFFVQDEMVSEYWLGWSVCGVVILLPQVCNICQVSLADMGSIVCLTCMRICSLRCIGCLMFSACFHGFVACCVGEQSVSLVRCCSVTLGTNAAVFVCYCDVCHVCCSILCQVTEVHLFIIWHCMAWTIEAFCEALCLSLFFEQSHVPQTFMKVWSCHMHVVIASD